MNLVCPTCGTDQERSAEPSQRCVVCGKELATEAAPAAASTEVESDGAAASVAPAASPAEPAAARLVAALPAKPAGVSAVDFEELRSGARVFEWLVAMVPLYGLARLSQTKLLPGFQKVVAGTLSVGLTVVLGSGLWAARGTGPKGPDLPADKVNGQIVALRDLIHQFRDQTGNLPSESEWKRSVETVDSQLFDPWGRAYVYERVDGGFRIGSLGRDGATGGDGDNADKFEAFTEVTS
ncbi:MAG: type II secretion system protein GspG [Candidatus Binatia bacterium]